MKNEITIGVEVNPALYEFILASNKSNVLVPDKYDLLWALVKQYLELRPQHYTPQTHTGQLIYIKIYENARSKQIYSKEHGRNIYFNPMFRCFLSVKGQRVIARHLNAQFKSCFLNFVQGAKFVNDKSKITVIVQSFCELYSIPFNHITYDMLKKTWQRSDQRKELNGGNGKSPLVF